MTFTIFSGVALAVSLPFVAAEECSAKPIKRFFTDGQAGDQDGYECLACPTQSILEYVQNPNDHFDPLSEAERFVLQYWEAMSRGDTAWMLGNYAGSGMLTRAGGPSMNGNRYTALGDRIPWDPYAEYEAQKLKGGLNYWWYAQFVDRVTWQGNGGLYSNDNHTGGLHAAIQDTVQISDDFALVTAIINGTQYDKNKKGESGNISAAWQSGKATVSVRKFPEIGWKIVQFTCSFLSFSWFPEGIQCMPGAASGIPPPHVDWTGDYEYAVKFTDQANYCSKKCTCGEAPVSKTPVTPCTSGIPNTLPYQNNVYIEPNKNGAQSQTQESKCQPCPVSGFTPAFPADSPENFALSYVKAMSTSDPSVLDMYDEHAVIIRNGGPMITGVDSNGGEFFTEIWPGLKWQGSAGAWSDLASTVHRSQRIGSNSAQVEIFTNGTLYSSDGAVAVPWMAKQIVVTAVNEAGAWKVVNVGLMDYNTNGVGRCTFDGSFMTYCTQCPCGEVEIMAPAVGKLENTVYHTAQMPSSSMPVQQQQTATPSHPVTPQPSVGSYDDPKAVIRKFLENTGNPDVLREIIAPDATYVSLNMKNEDLTRIMPWAGTHDKAGPDAFIDAFRQVNEFWHVDAFVTQTVFGEGENVMAVGSFSSTSVVLQKQDHSPFAIHAKVIDGKITYCMWLEDTLMTSSSLAKSGTRTYVSNPDTLEEVTL